MLNKNEDRDHAVQDPVQDSADRSTVGAPAARPGTLAPEGDSAPPAPADAPTGLPSAPTAPPDAPAGSAWCRRCSATVIPDAETRTCPNCRSFVRASDGARPRNRADPVRREALLALILKRYRPTTFGAESSCAVYAAVLEASERAKPGSQEFSRLVSLALQLNTNLEATVPAITETHIDDLNAEQLLARIERLHAVAIQLRDAERARVDAPAVMTVDTPVIVTENPARTAAPAPEPFCVYCHFSVTRCADIKRDNIETWRVLHEMDPAEVDRRITERDERERTTAALWREAGIVPPEY